MSKWTIDKTLEFCYGHRVWTQTLNSKYANDLKCACRHLHGHEGKIQVYLTGDSLDQTGMITDFRHLEWLKKWINEFIDHRFILDVHDPLFMQLIGSKVLTPVIVPGTTFVAGRQIMLDHDAVETPEYEYFEGFFVVDFVPTSENLSHWMVKIVESKMSMLGVS